MNSVHKLILWAIATDGKDEDKLAAQGFILKHFADQGMTEERLNKIVGPASMLSMIIAPIKENILLDPAFGWCSSA